MYLDKRALSGSGVPERKSRRTHKNSRDGCPNCKAKRIKCTEELPSCYNCIKKNSRCGYADFPKEKLEHIKRKNEKKKKQLRDGGSLEASDKDSGHESLSLGFLRDESTHLFISPLPVLHLLNYQQNEHQNLPNQGNKVPDSLTSYNLSGNLSSLHHASSKNRVPQLGEEFYITKNHLRNSLYNDVFINAVNGTVLPDNTSNLKSVETDFQKHIQGHNIVFPNVKDKSDSSLNIGHENFVDHLKDRISTELLSPATINDFKLKTLKSNSISGLFKFQKLVKAPKLRNRELSKILKKLPSNPSQMYVSYKVQCVPVWTEEAIFEFWTIVFYQACFMKIYFCFFIDHSLNTILRKCDRELASQVLSMASLESNVPNSNSSSSLSTPSCSQSFDEKELNKLIQHSYVSYGRLIKCLRESLSKMYIEYPAKISLYSSWSTYLNSHATVDTLSTMHNGYVTLYSKAINEAHDINDLSPGIFHAVHFFNDQSIASVIPDYNFGVISELLDDVQNFKAFMLKNRAVVERLEYKTLIQLLLGLENFLTYLVKEFHPRVTKLNNYYKLIHLIDDKSNNLYFISISMFFDLLVLWYKGYPGHFPTGSHVCGFRKTLYLMFLAVGKALMHIYSPIRSVMVADTCNLIFQRADFICEQFMFEKDNMLSEELNQYLVTFSHKLMRIIKFFEYRTLFYSYYLTTSTILNTDYLKYVGTGPNPVDDKHNDIVQLLPKVLDTNEVMLSSFIDSVVINAELYPIFDLIRENNKLTQFIDEEKIEQAQRQRNHPDTQTGVIFDKSCSLFTSDFNPSSLLAEFIGMQKFIWSVYPLTLEEMRTRVSNYQKGRLEIANSIKLSNKSV
ncbi:uncharacterized protein PRCAT00005182001 [Priceomyces carsonii]|uniref:uncharacterized protein n=1 Tax=Priceomyces carsonii TaxID=28549 RepID=UPI002ED97F34|nr:unnamed protein product [Priceomyces carsonii]